MPLSVAIVAICSESHLARCLASLTAQRLAPEFEIVVAAARHLGSLEGIKRSFPDIRLIAPDTRDSPIELAAVAVANSRGSVILLTEDHCVADSGWVAKLSAFVALHGRTTGGGLTPIHGLNAFDWAFYYVDFYRYDSCSPRGEATSISVCNVAYRREQLSRLALRWRDAFHETRVHNELMRQNGIHVFEPSANMSTGRRVGYRDGHRERYSFGRMFAAGRFERSDVLNRVTYSLGTAVLPAMLLGRMGAHAFRDRVSAQRFARALPHLVTLVFAWAWGELVGYVTGSPPRNRHAARERLA